MRDAPTQVFDGFAHRPFDPETDGWMQTLTPAKEFKCVAEAQSVLALFARLQEVERQVFHLKQALSKESPNHHLLKD